jgi:DNA-directed RNA polymerase subunit F
MSDREFIDFATVRDLLDAANERRGELSYEQMMALQHATWASSTNRGGVKTDPKVFTSLFSTLMENDKLAENPDICAKIAELTPMDVSGVRVIISSKRVAMDTSEIEEVIDIVKQHVL